MKEHDKERDGMSSHRRSELLTLIAGFASNPALLQPIMSVITTANDTTDLRTHASYVGYQRLLQTLALDALYLVDEVQDGLNRLARHYE